MQINAPISATATPADKPYFALTHLEPKFIQKRRLLALSVFEALVRVVAAYEGATSASVAGLAALAYAADAAAFLTEAYVHPGPRMPPPETGRDDLAPGLAHAIVAVLVYALLARRRRCCESKQRSGKRE